MIIDILLVICLSALALATAAIFYFIVTGVTNPRPVMLVLSFTAMLVVLVITSHVISEMDSQSKLKESETLNIK